MTGAACTRASSTESVKSPILDRGSVPDLRTFSATLIPIAMVNHGPSSYWGNHKPSNVILLHKVT